MSKKVGGDEQGMCGIRRVLFCTGIRTSLFFVQYMALMCTISSEGGVLSNKG